jgi:hypothetical protein
MSWPAIDTFRRWVSKRKGLLTGLLGVAVEEVVDLVPGGKLAVRIVGEVGKHGAERLLDTRADVPDVKPAGQAFSPEQLAEINAWLEALTASYAGLLDQMEKLTAASGDEPIQELTALVKQTLTGHDDLLRLFDASAQQVRRLTLSLSRIEEKLDVFFHGQQRIGLCLEDIKEVLVNSPLLGDWTEFRKASPEAVQALNRADEHFLAGRRDEGARELLGLLGQRGVGEETVCRALGIDALARGRLREANAYLARSGGGKKTMAPGLIATLTALGATSTRGDRLPVWRSLPRGLVVDRRYRVESEIGRGGMASVYRAAGVDLVNRGRSFALKVPAPELLADPAARARFVTEIQVAQNLSGRHPAILDTFGYAIFDDPHSGRELYGLVMEYIDGPTLAHFLAQRQAKNKLLEPEEILHVLKPVCEALEYAHSQGVYHRDVKPQNVLLTRKSQAKLADFGIARVLEDARATVTGQADVGTLAYMPPDLDFDARSDVYLLGNLLLELLTFHPRGDVEARADCPPAWAELVADSMNRLKGRRPQTARDFLTRLVAASGPLARSSQPASEGKPASGPLAATGAERIRQLIDAERYEEAMAEYRLLPHEHRPLALIEELQDKWRDRAYALARDAAETDHDYAVAVALLEKLPEGLRDQALLADYRARRDRLAQLRTAIHADVENGRHTFGLRARVAEYRRLKPDDPAINDLHRMLGDMPKETVIRSLGLKLVFVPGGTFWMGEKPE